MTPRQLARQFSLPTYNTGKPCKRGHTCDRRTCDAGCIQCTIDRKNSWYKNNADRVKITGAIYYKNNIEKVKTTHSAYYNNNKEKLLDYYADYRKNNQSKVRAGITAWKKANPDKRASSKAKRRCSQLQRTPSWVDPFERNQITELYKIANTLGAHVDHIVPLQGKLVSGLHVLSNLQLLTPSENLSKKNHYEVTSC